MISNFGGKIHDKFGASSTSFPTNSSGLSVVAATNVSCSVKLHGGERRLRRLFLRSQIATAKRQICRLCVGHEINRKQVPIGSNSWLQHSGRREYESNLAAVTGWRAHQLSDDTDDFLDRDIVCLQVLFQFFYPFGEFSICGQHLAQAHKSAHYENTHLHCPFRVEHGCGHNRTMFGKGVCQRSPATTSIL